MRCPFCGAHQSKVVDTREAGESIRRRRECRTCGKRFTTYERIAPSIPQVVKRDGRREEFSREKILRGVRIACAKRPIATEDLERLVNQIETQVYALGKNEVPSRVIGDMVMEGLKKLDEVAYIRFAIVYLPLSDLESVQREIGRLLETKE